MTLRDIQLKRQERQAQKKDIQVPYRAKITDIDGNDTGTGSIWFDEDKRLVWHLKVGGGTPQPVRCLLIGQPQIGIGVEVGYRNDNQVEIEILGDDPFLRDASDTVPTYQSPTANDFRWAGRVQQWLDTEAIIPLATYIDSSDSGLQVSVANGDYGYGGERITFNGQVNVSLSGSQPAGPSEHLLVGLYLDANSSLQTVDGATVATTVDAPEPAWPDGAFRLSVVDLDDSQTTIVPADIEDRRLLFNQPSGLDFAIWLISGGVVALYNNLNTAYTDAATGDTILLWPGTYTLLASITWSKNVNLIGTDRDACIVSTAVANAPISIQAADVYMANFTFTNTREVADTTECMLVFDVDGVVFDNVVMITTNPDGSSNTSGLYVLSNSNDISVKVLGGAYTGQSGGTNYGIRVEDLGGGGSATVKIVNPICEGADGDIRAESSNTTIELVDPVLVNDTLSNNGGALEGEWVRGSDHKFVRIDDGIRAPTENIWRNGAALSDSDFVATINGTPSGTSVVYNAPSSGDENNLPVNSTGQFAKIVLHNTTRGDYALIEDCNTGTNTITLTATVPGTWASGDTITIRSQTNTDNPGAASVYFVDFEFTSEITFETGFLSQWTLWDSGSILSVWLHPFETGAENKRRTYKSPSSIVFHGMLAAVPIISSRFCAAWQTSGSGTGTLLLGRLTEVRY